MDKKIKSLQILYCFIIAVAAIFAVFSETGVLPTDYVENEPRLLYWVNLYAIFVAFVGMFICLRLFIFKKVRTAVLDKDEMKACAAFVFWTKYRLSILAVALWSNTLLHFSTSYTSTPQYCIFITLITCVFCWPSLSSFYGLRKVENNRDSL